MKCRFWRIFEPNLLDQFCSAGENPAVGVAHLTGLLGRCCPTARLRRAVEAALVAPRLALRVPWRGGRLGRRLQRSGRAGGVLGPGPWMAKLDGETMNDGPMDLFVLLVP